MKNFWHKFPSLSQSAITIILNNSLNIFNEKYNLWSPLKFRSIQKFQREKLLIIVIITVIKSNITDNTPYENNRTQKQ